MNSLTSSETELPYDYYSMPFCKPAEGIRKSASASVNPGTILAGSNVQNSPYNFSILVRALHMEEACICRTGRQAWPLTQHARRQRSVQSLLARLTTTMPL